MRRPLPLLLALALALALAPKAFAQQGYQPGSTVVSGTVGLTPGTALPAPTITVFSAQTITATIASTIESSMPAMGATITYSVGTPTGTSPTIYFAISPVDQNGNPIGTSATSGLLTAATNGAVSVRSEPATAWKVTVQVSGTTPSWPNVTVQIILGDRKAAGNNVRCEIAHMAAAAGTGFPYSSPCSASVGAFVHLYLSDFEISTDTAGNYDLIAGTGPQCSTGTVTLLAGPYLAGNSTVPLHFETPIEVPTGDALCVLSFAATGNFGSNVLGYIAP